MSQINLVETALRSFGWDKRWTREDMEQRARNVEVLMNPAPENGLSREADHRIKNSLQIVASLLTTQALRDSNDATRAALLSAATRVQAIAGIHDALQASSGQDVVNLGDALNSMCLSLHTMAGDPRAVTVSVVVEPVAAPVELAQPILLAVNELVVNALRHAFPNARAGTVRVSLTQAGRDLRVVVADNGIGLPAHHSDCQRPAPQGD